MSNERRRDREDENSEYKWKERPGWFRGAWVGAPLAKPRKQKERKR